MSSIHVCHQYVYVINTCISSIRVRHQFVYVTNTCTSPIRVRHQYVYVTNTCMSSICVCHQYLYVINNSHSNDHSVTYTTWAGVIQSALRSVNNTWSGHWTDPGSTQSAHLSHLPSQCAPCLPLAIRIIWCTMSMPVMHSVMGCSTCSRVFISRK